MILEFYHVMVEFLKANPELVALCLAVVQLIKLAIKEKPFYKEWMGVAIAAIISLAMALPASFEAFDYVLFAASGIGLFLMATGIYKLLKEMIASISVEV